MNTSIDVTRQAAARLIFTMCLAALAPARAAVSLYPAPEQLQPAKDVEVHVEGTPVFVYDSPVAPFAHFSFTGAVHVRLTLHSVESGRQYTAWGKTYRPEIFHAPIRVVDVRPHSLRIQPIAQGNTVSFELSRPANLVVEVNGNLTRPIFLFAAPPEAGAPRPGDPNVRYFAPGKVYDVGRLALKTGETVYIAGGAVVRGAIEADGVRNVRILGRGVLDGSDAEKVPWPLIEIRRSSNVSVEGIVVLNDRGWTIVPRHSDDVRIANIKMIAWNNNSDGVDIVGCRRLSIHSSFFRNNDDCIPIKAAGDGSDLAPPPPERRGASQYDVVGVDVRDCVFWKAPGGNAIEIGFELRTDTIRDVVFQNCDIIHVENGAAISIHNGDWATVRDIRFEDIRIEDAPDELFDLYIGVSMYSADCPWEYHRSNPQRKPLPPELRAEKTGAHSGQWLRLPEAQDRERLANRGHIQNVLFRNIRVTGPQPSISRFVGHDADHTVENLTVEGLTIQGKPVLSRNDARVEIRFARNVRFLPAADK